MTKRSKKTTNRYWCRPSEDVCLEHDEPLICKHGCICAKQHNHKVSAADANKIVEGITRCMWLYSGYKVESRGPSGILLDIIEKIRPDVAHIIRLDDPQEAMNRFFKDGEDNKP